MGKMKKYVAMFCAMLALGVAGTSCSSDEEVAQGETTGKGLVKLAVNVGAEFQQSRAITESDYTNLANYTVQILSSTGQVIDGCEWKGDAIPQELIELSNGSYTLKAFTGEDYKGIGATTTGMYVEGTYLFNVNGNQVAEATVNCTPQCARVKVNFGAEMATYFQDYYVVFSGTKALGSASYTWAKTNTDPVYMAVSSEEQITATINLVDNEGKVAADIVKTYTLAPAKALNLTIEPAVESGNLGITIELDEKTTDIPVDIEIPADWL